jgi:DNA-binding FrmR family transcriptional regulator
MKQGGNMKMDHTEVLSCLRKIEGQIRGVQKMIEEKKYCINILTQLHAIVGGVENVKDKILRKHFETCIVSAFKGNSKKDREEKMGEILNLISKFRE